MLRGTFESDIYRNRIVLPKRFYYEIRSNPLWENAYVVRRLMNDRMPFLCVMPKYVFEEFNVRSHPNIQDVYSTNVYPAHGELKVHIEEGFRRFAALEDKVKVMGAERMFEIWSPENFEDMLKVVEENFERNKTRVVQIRRLMEYNHTTL